MSKSSQAVQAAVPALTLTITTPANDGDALDFSGGPPRTATALGNVGPTATMMAYQIGTAQPIAMTFQPGMQWSITLTDTDCPTAGDSYTLTVYAWSATSGTSRQRTFVRQDA